MATEKRLIDADKLIEKFLSLTLTVTGVRAGKDVVVELLTKYRNGVLQLLKEQPTVAAAEVVHGQWEPCKDFYGYSVCSACRGCYVAEDWIGGDKWKYCPHCGAKMGGGNNA